MPVVRLFVFSQPAARPRVCGRQGGQDRAIFGALTAYYKYTPNPFSSSSFFLQHRSNEHTKAFPTAHISTPSWLLPDWNARVPSESMPLSPSRRGGLSQGRKIRYAEAWETAYLFASLCLVLISRAHHSRTRWFFATTCCTPDAGWYTTYLHLTRGASTLNIGVD